MGQVAGLAVVVVCTLHRYDDIGLLVPSERSNAGHRCYGDKDPEQHAEEAEQRWGGTEAYAESQRRAAGYTKADWKRMQAEVNDWGERYDALMADGEPPTGGAALAMAEEHRLHICTWFYDCPYEMHVGLAEMYVSDERFKAFYDAMRPGLAEHLRDAIRANAARNSS